MSVIEFFFPPRLPIAIALNLAILGLAIASLRDVWRALASARSASEDVATLTGVSAPSESADDNAPNGESSAAGVPLQGVARSLQEKSERLRKQSPVRQRIAMLVALRQKGEPVDREMLAAITAEEFRAAAPVARWATTALVLLGLAGTLVGLSLAVGELSGSLGSANMTAQVMKDAILATLGQMKLAFSTTLGGVTGAVLVTSSMAYLRQIQSDVLRRLESVAAAEWTPLFQTTEEKRIGDAVRELEETRKALKSGLDDTLTKIDTGFGNLEAQFRKRSKRLLQQVGELRDATLTIIGERDSDMSLADYVETVKDTTERLQEGVEATSRMLPRIQEALAEAIRVEQQALFRALTDHTERITPILERQEEAAESLSSAMQSEVDRLHEMRDILERLNSSFEAARGTWERADETIRRMGQTTADAIREGLAQSLEAVKELTEAQSENQERVTAALEAFQRVHQDTLRLLGDQSGRALNQSQAMLVELRRTLMESLDLIGQRLEDAQRGPVERVTSGLAALGRELRDVGGRPSVPKRQTERSVGSPEGSPLANPGIPVAEPRRRTGMTDSSPNPEAEDAPLDQVREDLSDLL